MVVVMTSPSALTGVFVFVVVFFVVMVVAVVPSMEIPFRTAFPQFLRTVLILALLLITKLLLSASVLVREGLCIIVLSTLCYIFFV